MAAGQRGPTGSVGANRRARASGTDRYLIPDERAEIETRRHWMVLAGPVVKSLGVVAVVMFLYSRDPYSEVMQNVTAAVILAVIGYVTYKVAQWRMDHFVVTNRRVLLVSGVLTKRTAVMPLLKVTDLTYEQSPLARILRYGTFVFESAGQDQALSRVSHLPGGPRQLYKQISELLFNYQGLAMQAPPPSRMDRHHTVNLETGEPGRHSVARHTTAPIPRLGPDWAADD